MLPGWERGGGSLEGEQEMEAGELCFGHISGSPCALLPGEFSLPVFSP